MLFGYSFSVNSVVVSSIRLHVFQNGIRAICVKFSCFMVRFYFFQLWQISSLSDKTLAKTQIKSSIVCYCAIIL